MEIDLFGDSFLTENSSNEYCSTPLFSKIEGFPKLQDFIAIDFETAKGKNPCQIGMAIIHNGEITETINRLIRPKDNDYSPNNIAVHHITPSMTENAPDFGTVWNEIMHYFEGAYIIAHNANFDMGVLEYMVRTLGLSIPNIAGYICTCEQNNREGLELACARYGISLSKHHDGEDDAVNCAKLYLAYINGQLPLSDDELPEQFKKKNTRQDYWATVFEGHSDLHGDILKMDLEGADPANPFYSRKVVITGIFDIDRCELAKILKGMGADIDKSVGPKLNYLLIGDDPGPAKLRKVDEMIESGKNIKKIFQNDLNKILEGIDWDLYHTELPIQEFKLHKEKKIVTRKTTWPDLVAKFQRSLEGEHIEFNEREIGSEDYRILKLYIKQQQKVALTKKSVLDNLRDLDTENEKKFRAEVLSEFKVGEQILQEEVYERLQKIFSHFALSFKARKCVLTEFNIEYDEYKVNGLHHISINYIPEI